MSRTRFRVNLHSIGIYTLYELHSLRITLFTNLHSIGIYNLHSLRTKWLWVRVQLQSLKNYDIWPEMLSSFDAGQSEVSWCTIHNLVMLEQKING